MKVEYDDTIMVTPSIAADDVRLTVREEGEVAVNYYLLPKQARKLAKKLKRAAREIEARQ